MATGIQTPHRGERPASNRRYKVPDIENARDLFEDGLPDIDPADPAGDAASSAADDMHGEVDGIAEGADPDGVGHGPTPDSE